MRKLLCHWLGIHEYTKWVRYPFRPMLHHYECKHCGHEKYLG